VIMTIDDVDDAQRLVANTSIADKAAATPMELAVLGDDRRLYLLWEAIAVMRTAVVSHGGQVDLSNWPTPRDERPPPVGLALLPDATEVIGPTVSRYAALNLTEPWQ